MKRSVVIILMVLVCGAVPLLAQDTSSTPVKPEKSVAPVTLFGFSDMHFSGYGALQYQGSMIGEAYGNLAGMRAGLIVNDSFVIGFNGWGLAHPRKREDISDETYTGLEPNAELGYGGLLLEYHIAPKSLFHVALGVTVGGGSIVYTSESEDGDDHNKNNDTHTTDKFFYVEPEIGGYVNIARFCRVGVTASYRYTNGAGRAEIKDADIRGFAGGVVAEFGWF